MRNKILFIAFLLPFAASAQCKDCFKMEDSWKVAAGVTLYSNNDYTGKYIELPHRPLEFNLRYKINNHVIRISSLAALKVNLPGSIFYPRNFDGKESLEDYYKMLVSESGRGYFQMIENYYSLYGGTLGYDYNFNFTPKLSAFIGVDLAYYYTVNKMKYYDIYYFLSADNTSKIITMEYVKVNNHFNECAVKPVAGIRYQFQKLLFEVSLDYSFNAIGYTAINETNQFYPDNGSSNQYSEKSTQPFIGTHSQLDYLFSLFYTF